MFKKKGPKYQGYANVSKQGEKWVVSDRIIDMPMTQEFESEAEALKYARGVIDIVYNEDAPMRLMANYRA